MHTRKTLHHLLPIAVITLVFLFIYLVPLPRQVGLSMRYDLTIVAALVFPLGALCLHPKGLYGDLLTALLIALLFALPLSGLWSSGQSETFILFGILPLNDAQDYHQSALRILSGQPFIGFSADRPIGPALLSIFLRLTGGNLQLTLLLQTALCALASMYLLRWLRAKWSTLPAALFLVLLFFFYRQFIGSTLTENYGLFPGLLAFGLLLYWAEKPNPRLLLMAVVLLTIALNIRAGAYLLLPALLLMAFLFRHQLPRRTFTLILLGILIGFAFNILVAGIYSQKIVLIGNNSRDVFYRLVTNSDYWYQFARDHPEIDRADTAAYTRMIVEEFRRNPAALLQGIWRSYTELFSFSRTGAFGFLEGERVHTTRWTVWAGSLVLFLLSLLGILRAWLLARKSRDLPSLILLFSLLGILLSVPFIFPGDYSGMRYFAATISFQLILPAAGLKFILERVKWFKRLDKASQPSAAEGLSLFSFSAALLAILCLGLLLNPFLPQPNEVVPFTCQADEVPVAFTVTPGSYVTILPDAQVVSTWLPIISASRARASSHGLSVYFSTEYEMLKPPLAFYSGLDHLSGRVLNLVLTPAEVARSGEQRACLVRPELTFLKSSGFLFSRQALSQ